MESKRTKIMPNDTVLHKPSGETWGVWSESRAREVDSFWVSIPDACEY